MRDLTFVTVHEPRTCNIDQLRV